MTKYIINIEQKKKELAKAKSEFICALRYLCTKILKQRTYNRKYRKCLVYCVYQKFDVTQKEISEMFDIHQSYVVLYTADVKRWIDIKGDEIIKSYVKEINEKLCA